MNHIRRTIGAALAVLALLAILAPNAATPSFASLAQATQVATQAATVTATSTPTQATTPVPTLAATQLATSAPTLAATQAGTQAASTSGTITIEGSQIVSPVLKSAADQYKSGHPDVTITVNPSGTVAGFDKLCSGTADMAMAVDAISDQQAATCNTNKVNYIETLLGFNALAILVNSASSLTCLTPDQVNKLLSPSGGANNWQVVDSSLGNVPITAIYSTPADSKGVVLANSLVTGGKIRSDVKMLDSAQAVSDQLGKETNAVGLMSAYDFNNLSGTSSTLKALQMKTNATAPCVDSSQVNLEAARYPEVQSLYLYINAASLDRKPVTDFLTSIFQSQNASLLLSNGFTDASTTTYDRDQHYIDTRQTGRTFSRIQTINVPPDTAGTISTEGAADAATVIKAINDAFSPRYSQIKLTLAASGNDTAFNKLCTNNVDLIGTTRPMGDSDVASCKKANIDTLQLQMGISAVVVVVNDNNKFATCLKLDQIGNLFSLSGQDKVKKWSDVDSSFPGTTIMVIGPNPGDAMTDLLLGKTVKGLAPLPRTDMVNNDDPLYRAAGTANVGDAVTYMAFSDLQKSSAKVHAVAVDAGKGCVTPTLDTIKNGTYPLAETEYVVFNLNSFSRPEVKAFVWYLLSDDALSVIAKQGLVATDTTGFTAARDTALARFAATTPAATQPAQSASPTPPPVIPPSGGPTSTPNNSSGPSIP